MNLQFLTRLLSIALLGMVVIGQANATTPQDNKENTSQKQALGDGDLFEELEDDEVTDED